MRWEIDAALADYEAAIRAAPFDLGAHYRRAGVYGYLGRFDEALADLTLLIEHGDSPGIVYVSRASVYAMKNQYGLALADFDSAMRFMDPTNVLQFRALVKVQMGDYDGALADVAAYSSPSTHDSNALLTKADALVGLHRFVEAEAIAGPLSALNPDDEWRAMPGDSAERTQLWKNAMAAEVNNRRAHAFDIRGRARARWAACPTRFAM